MMGCRSWEGEWVVFGNEDMRTGIFSTCTFLSGIPLIIGIQRPALPIIACQTINAATFLFSRAASLGNRNHHSVAFYWTFSPPASSHNNILFFIILGTYYQII